MSKSLPRERIIAQKLSVGHWVIDRRIFTWAEENNGVVKGAEVVWVLV